MESDFTQQQSLGGLERAEQLSINATVPPAEVAGFRMDKLLGRGAFGQVWLAHDLNTGRKVAIKFYLSGRKVNWQLINREVKHLVSMSTGRYIVQVLQVGWEADPPYYIMEYLENGSLEDLIRAQGSLSIPHTAKMIREIAEGLSYAHSKGVLHCDLKPANVMLDPDFRPRLADFGQSRMSDDQTPSLGTLFFMAPEQADLEAPPDAAWDVYALGAIAYCILVGSPPYRTPEIVETLDTADSLSDRLQRYRETIRSAHRPRLHYRRRGIDKGLCQIIDRCLETSVERRYANVQQVIGALEARTRVQSRRPLYLLGIVAPVLLFALMLLFSVRSIGVAKRGAIQELGQIAVKSNEATCLYASKSLESELAALFDLVEDESRELAIRPLIQDVLQEGQPLLQDLSDGQADATVTEQFKELPSQRRLAEYLEQRLQTILTTKSESRGMFNSVFVNDARGTNLGISFAESEDSLRSSPVGLNWAYRSYFNGQRADGNRTAPRSTFRPTRVPHLSANFRSTSTNKWKVGISCPIWSSTNSPQNDQEEPLGVLVFTINLGNFELLVGDRKDRSERFACLIDGRAGAAQGTLIQHPFLRRQEQSKDSVKAIPKIDGRFLAELTKSDGITNYLDPTSEYEGGEEFEGEWIAALEPVRLPGRNNGDSADNMSDLWVLVQQRSSVIAQPVDNLGYRLQTETFIEFGALLCVMLVLWFFVYRLGQASQTAGGAAAEGFHSSSYHSSLGDGR